MPRYRKNATVPELLEQYEQSGVMPPEFGGSSVQTSARPRGVKRRGKVKVPKIGDWKRTPKQRGLKQGYLWKPPAAWRPASGYFYIFPAPNKRSAGATRFFYVTDGIQVLSTQHRTKSEAVKALKGILKGDEAKLRVNPPNPLTRHEQGQIRWRAMKDMRRAMAEPTDAQQMYRVGRTESAVEIARDFGPGRTGTRGAPVRGNPEDGEIVDVNAELSTDVYAERENPLTDEETMAVLVSESHASDFAATNKRLADSAGEPQAGTWRGNQLHDEGEAWAYRRVRERFGADRENPLTDEETRKVMGRKFSSERMAQRHPDPGVRQFHAGAGHAYNDVVTQFGQRVGRAHRSNPANPLTFTEVEEIEQLADQAEGAKNKAPWPDSMYHRGKEDAFGHVSADFNDQVRDEYGMRKPTRTAKKKAKRKRKNPHRRAARAAKAQRGGLSIPQHRMLERLTRGTGIGKSDLQFGELGTLQSLVRMKLVSELKTKWKITAKGRKLVAPRRRKNPKMKPTMRKLSPEASRRLAKKATKKAAKKKAAPKRRNAANVCKFTVALEKGKRGARCTISYPKGIFKSREEALRNIQTELRAKFKRLSKAPAITSCAWRYTDKGKTRGRWHFTAKKAA